MSILIVISINTDVLDSFKHYNTVQFSSCYPPVAQIGATEAHMIELVVP